MNLIGLFVAVVLGALGLILLGGAVLAVVHLGRRSHPASDTPSKLDPAQAVYAPWGRRAGGALINGFATLTFYVPAILGLVVLPSNKAGSVFTALAIVGLFALLALYSFSVGTRGQFWGHKAVGIRIVDASTGTAIGISRAFARQLFSVINGVPVMLGWLWPLWDERHQTFTDKLFHTISVRATSQPIAEPEGQTDPEIGVKLRLAGIVIGAYTALFVLHKLIDGGGAMPKVLDTLYTVASGVLFLALLVAVLYWGASQYPEPWRERLRVAVFIGPALTLLVGGLVLPSLTTAKMSLYTGDPAKKWYGLGNFRDLFTKHENLLLLRNTFWWVILATLVSTMIGIVVARLADRMRGESAAKALIFLPMAISMVGAGVIWRFIYDKNRDIGLLNWVWVHLDGVLPGKQEPHLWLQDTSFFGIKNSWLPGSNTVFMIIVFIWIQAGFATVVMSAALKGVPDDLVEAAKIDGATERQAFFKVVLPYVKPTIITVLTTIAIACLKIFDIVQAMGLGGSFDNNVLASDMYTKSFTQGNQGLGSAIAVVIFIAVAPVVWINVRNIRSQRSAR